MTTATLAPTLSGDEIVALCAATPSSSGPPRRKVDPIPVDRAEGIYFWTPEGKRYLDFNSQLMCINIGHSHPRWSRPSRSRRRSSPTPTPSWPPSRARGSGAKLAELTPGDIDIFFFTNGGAEANENAIRSRGWSPAGTRSWRATARTTAAPRGRSPSPAIRAAGPPSRASRASCASPTSTSGARRTRSPWPRASPSSKTSSATRAATPSRPSSSRRSWARTASSFPPTATSRACARSATATASCSSPTRS